jgi:imidazole glycerol-phosphate synthase subunit HisF
MLKKRIAASILVKDGVVVQSLGFSRYLPVGRPAIAIEFVNAWGIDEILLIDISATRASRPPDFKMVSVAAAHCGVPLAVGGGIANLDHVKQLMHSGADKVCFNQAALNNPELIRQTAHMFGEQCVVASIDSITTRLGPRVYDYLTATVKDEAPSDMARRMQDLGVGEILINSVDRDGSRTGFDLELAHSVSSAVTLPVICCGGAGIATHFAEIFQNTGVSAAAAANFFHFTEHSVTTVKAQLSRELPVRHESYASYVDACFDNDGRLLKKPDQELERMRFVIIEKEFI